MKSLVLRTVVAVMLIFAFIGCERKGADSDVDVSDVNLEKVSSGVVSRFKKENKGKVLLVNFFASWCPPCRGETPDFVETYNEMSDRLTIIGLSTDAKPNDAKKYIKEFNVTYPVYLADRSLSAEYGINTIPTNIIYKPDGTLLDIIVGPITKKDLIYIVEKYTDSGS
ncbi:TlpA family protein disulfide reductase [Limisalsivibrio acetivorans]|uniref:TlpA family protein disulfide reductase n=1 Tax=Limisalsivibrio acetivorans TaxID=1304888 RepID=UPI0003B6676E|nr:TlpA disulfide reductase family protein [Limisalsivibrio acetivorans]